MLHNLDQNIIHPVLKSSLNSTVPSLQPSPRLSFLIAFSLTFIPLSAYDKVLEGFTSALNIPRFFFFFP